MGQKNVLYVKGSRNSSPSNMFLRHKYYFRLIIFKNIKHRKALENYSFVRDICIYKEISIFKVASLFVPREE